MVRADAYTVDTATAADEPAIRALLREPMDGEIRVALEREPDARLASTIEGDRHHTVVTRDAAGGVVGMGSRSVRRVWLDGEPARLGYLSQMRRSPGGGRLPLAALRAGYAAFDRDRRTDELPFDLTSIIADNRPARRLLEAGLDGIPPYRPLAELVTCLVPTRGALAGRFSLRPFRPARLPPTRPARDRLEVVSCLQRNLRRYQLAPIWTAEDLTDGDRCRQLDPSDFAVVPGADGIRACAALWDQRAFKQARVHGYSPALGRARPFLNPLLVASGRPPLPPPGAVIANAYLSHIAVDDDDPAPFLALVEDARRRARNRAVDWLTIGFVRGHPLLAALLDAARLRTYDAILYAVGADPETVAPGFRSRRLYVEVATL